jgi:hypothetical protein
MELLVLSSTGSMEHLPMIWLLRTYCSILCWLQAPWNIWFYPVQIAGSLEHMVLSCVDCRLLGTCGSILCYCRLHGTYGSILCWLQAPWNILFYPVLIAGSMEHIVLSCADCRLHRTSGSVLCWLLTLWNIWFYPVLIACSLEHMILSCTHYRRYGTSGAILCWSQAP